MRKARRWLLVSLACLGALLVTPIPTRASSPSSSEPQNVIVFIGDGMGPEQVEIGRRIAGGSLELDAIDWDAEGTLDTSSLDGVTDSAAGATALATGYETHNEWVSMIPGSPDPIAVETALERAQEHGKVSGLVTTVDLPDATTAAFGAHVTDRGEGEDVSQQFVEEDIEVLLGGTAWGDTDPLLGREADGVTYVDTADELADYADSGANGPIVGLYGPGVLAYALDRDEEGAVGLQPTLAEMTMASIEILDDDPDGFFLVVEGGAIDWAGHSRDAAWTAAEMMAFDEAIGAAGEWATGDGGDTLIVVTADHECGGLELSRRTDLDRIRAQTASTEFMWGAIRDGATIRRTLATHAGVTDLTRSELRLIERNKEMGIADVLAARQKVTWGWSGTDEGEHTDTPVPLWALGPGAGAFAGFDDEPNESVGRALLELVTP